VHALGEEVGDAVGGVGKQWVRRAEREAKKWLVKLD
jgi:hypothetical protein